MLLFDEMDDLRIYKRIPLVKGKTILYVGNPEKDDVHQNELFNTVRERFEAAGFKFIYVPDLIEQLTPEVLQYYYPGLSADSLRDDIYKRLRKLASISGAAGFMYRKAGAPTYFHATDSMSDEQFLKEVDSFIERLTITDIPKPSRAARPLDDIKPKREYKKAKPLNLDSKETYEAAIPNLNESIYGENNPFYEVPDELDSRTQAILRDWYSFTRKYGVTLEDVDNLLGYTVRLIPMRITTANKILLTDKNGSIEVKLDDLTKAIYFFYLKHPEGATLKELYLYEKEILGIYEKITGRGEPEAILRSITNLLNPLEGRFNSNISRIKKAFKDIFDDRIARFYYVDGTAGETRKINLDRKLVTWDNKYTVSDSY